MVHSHASPRKYVHQQSFLSLNRGLRSSIKLGFSLPLSLLLSLDALTAFSDFYRLIRTKLGHVPALTAICCCICCYLIASYTCWVGGVCKWTECFSTSTSTNAVVRAVSCRFHYSRLFHAWCVCIAFHSFGDCDCRASRYPSLSSLPSAHYLVSEDKQAAGGGEIWISFRWRAQCMTVRAAAQFTMW